MKKIIIIAILSFTAFEGIHAQTTGTISISDNVVIPLEEWTGHDNWIRKTTYRDAYGNRGDQSISYYDGLGYPRQIVEKAASPNSAKDIITPIYYDQNYRETRAVLPYPGNGDTGAADPAASVNQISYYGSIYNENEGQFAYTEDHYDNSPQNRIIKSFMPGYIYREKYKFTGYDYSSNAREDGSIIHIILAEDGNAIQQYEYLHYTHGTLQKTSVTDEDGSQVITFLDMSGKCILSRNKLDTQILDTYYVYDDYNRLRWVVTPECSAQLDEGFYIRLDPDNPGLGDDYCYVYQYDSRHRLTEKKLPGADPVHMVYDKADRLVMSQDGNMRAARQWNYYTYDNFDRQVKSEILTVTAANNSRVTLQSVIDTRSEPPYLKRQLLSRSVYDSYDTGTSENPDTVNYGVLAFRAVSGFDPGYDTRVKGLATYFQMAVLDGDCITEDFVERALYYDYKGRLIQTVEKNHLGGISRYCNKYDFAGILLASYEEQNLEESFFRDNYEPLVQGLYFIIHPEVCLYSESGTSMDPNQLFLLEDDRARPEYHITNVGGADYYYIPESCMEMVFDLPGNDPTDTYEITTWFPGPGIPLAYLGDDVESESDCKYTQFTYDHRGRILSETTTLNDHKPTGINFNYDELGRLSRKSYYNNLPGRQIFSENYEYNLQGWLTGQESDVFEMKLRYYDPLKSETTASYAGNITEWERLHKGPDGAHLPPSTYAFKYDLLGRLTGTDQYQGSSTAAIDNFTERDITYDYHGNIVTLQRTGRGELIHDLNYEYSGNRLTALENNGSASPGSFTYAYDPNGNMTFDGRQRVGLEYNHLNVVGIVRDENGRIRARYSWLADGTKLGVTTGDGNKGYEYLGSMVYERMNGSLALESAEFGGGRIYAVTGISPEGVVSVSSVRPATSPGTGTGIPVPWEPNEPDHPDPYDPDDNGKEIIDPREPVDPIPVDPTDHVDPGDGGDTGGPSGPEINPGNVYGYQVAYFIKDHLGSVRVVVDDDGTVLSRHDYYPFGLAWSDPGMQTGSNRYLYNGKELQEMASLEFLDYGARMSDPLLGRWGSADPLAEKYFSTTPYAYTLNNPVRFIDPDGRDVWEIDHLGRVRWISEDDQHVMYALAEDGSRTGQSITVSDRKIFDQLTATGEGSFYDASYASGNPSELGSVFLFAADNSNAEWRFSRYDTGNGDQYSIGTVHKDNASISPEQMGFSRDSEIAFIHSHPSEYTKVYGRGGELGSMGWIKEGQIYSLSDSHNVYSNPDKSSYQNYYTYFPHSGNVYRVRGYDQPAFIRNIKNHGNNPKKIFWGVLNGK